MNTGLRWPRFCFGHEKEKLGPLNASRHGGFRGVAWFSLKKPKKTWGHLNPHGYWETVAPLKNGATPKTGPLKARGYRLRVAPTSPLSKDRVAP